MYYDLNMLEGTGIQILNHQILIQISYRVKLISRNCEIAECFAMCRYLIFDKMNRENLHFRRELLLGDL